MKCVAAIDPGVSTGFALRLCNGVYLAETILDPNELWDHLRDAEPDVIICEEFKTQEISKYGLFTVRVYGGAEAAAFFLGAEFVKHQPANRTGYLDLAGEQLDAIGVKYTKSHPDNHAYDAMGHLKAWEYHHPGE